MHRCVILICVTFFISDEFGEQVEAKHRDVFVPYTTNGKWAISNEDSIPDAKVPVITRNTIYESTKTKSTDVRENPRSQKKSKRKAKHHKRKPMTLKRTFTKTNETESVSEERKSMPVDIVVHIKMNE